MVGKRKLITNVETVRLHLNNSVVLDRTGSRETPGMTLEGLLAGIAQIGTVEHYILWNAKILEGEDKSTTLAGHVEVPVARVVFYQVMPK